MTIAKPNQVATPFANSGLKNSIPQSATGSNLASLEEGFPAVTMTAVADGGSPPQGQDFNGILNQVTNQLRYAQAGGLYPYDSTFCTAIGGYPLGAILMSADGRKIWQNQAAGNTNNPDSDDTNWLSFQNTLTFDTTPTASSSNPVTSGGVKSALDGKFDKSGGSITGDTSINVNNWKITSNVANYNDCFRNSIYRGKYLGSSLTAAQSAAIQAGTFDDMYIGDYWTINSVNYRIAAFDYYYMCGDDGDSGSITNRHHVVIVPDRHLYSAQMNETNIVTGAYVGSKMYAKNLEQAKTTITSAFGAAHLLSVRQYFQNATNADYGFTTAGAWYDATVWLMNEINVYGCRIWSNYKIGNANANLHTTDDRQYPLFRFWPIHRQAGSRFGFWLRDTATATNFANVSGYGNANYYGASNANGVRPAFCII